MTYQREPRDGAVALGGPVAGLSFVSGVAIAMASAASPFPRPGATADDIQRYFTGSSTAARVSVVGQLISSAALAAFSAAVVRLCGRSTSAQSPLEAAAIAGGALASGSLATAAVCAAALTGPPGRDAATAVALHRRAFLAGGPVHGAGFGLLLGALGLAALRTGALSRRLALAALVSAVANGLSLLYLVAPPAAWLVPLGRFSGLVIAGIAGVRLWRQAR